MFTGKPLFVVRRTKVLRVLTGVIVPFAIMLAVAGVERASAKVADVGSAATLIGLALIVAGVCVYVWWHEFKSVKNLYEDGIEAILGSRRKELRWDDVREVWFKAIRIRTGGLVGGLAGRVVEAAVDAARGPQKLNQSNTSIQIRLVGASGTTIRLNSNDTNVVRAYEIAVARINPRLVDAGWRAVQERKDLRFGPLTLSAKGIARGSREPIRFADLERPRIEKGYLRIKKKGKWIDSISVPVAKIPNVFVMLDLFTRLTNGGATARPLDSSVLATTA